MKCRNEYELDELVPVVAWLSDKFTSKESSSICVERAQQLMEAILYCINELGDSRLYLPSTQEKISAFEAYHHGYEMVLKKVKDTQETYEKLLHIFNDYGNENLYDTVKKGLFGFFQYYDPRFEPQNTILTMDYPVLNMEFSKKGIDVISKYVDTIYLEQKFLNKLQTDYVQRVLKGFDSNYEKQFFNISACICNSIIMNSWIKDEQIVSHIDDSYELLWKLLQQYSQLEMSEIFHGYLHLLVLNRYDGNQEFEEYFSYAIEELSFRLSQAEDKRFLKNIVYL